MDFMGSGKTRSCFTHAELELFRPPKTRKIDAKSKDFKRKAGNETENVKLFKRNEPCLLPRSYTVSLLFPSQEVMQLQGVGRKSH